MKEPQRMFWLVWNEHRGLPKHKHFTEQEANQEAKRLAQSAPGEEFHVLRLVRSGAYCAVVWREPKWEENDYEPAF